MNRTVGDELDVTALVESQVELQVAVARSPGLEVDDTLVVTHEGKGLDVEEVSTTHHGRLHTVTLPAGPSRITYRAHVHGRADLPATDPADLSLHRRPSHYAESDRLGPFAAAEFAGVGPGEVLDAVSSWVGTRLSYVPGSSGPLDGALETLLAGTGVCRDYAHLAVALLRSLGVPARLVPRSPRSPTTACPTTISDSWWSSAEDRPRQQWSRATLGPSGGSSVGQQVGERCTRSVAA